MKIKSFIVSCILVISLLPVNIFAVNEIAQREDSKYNNALRFITALGITRGMDIQDPVAAVKRSEFTAMVVRAMNVKANNLADGSFSDVKEGDDFYQEIYTAKSIRLITGSEGKFMPNDSISYGMAYKILLTGLGYETLANAKGGYPIGYITVANSLHLTSGVKESDGLTFQEVVPLIFKALTTDLMVVDTVYEDASGYQILRGSNFLTENFDLTLKSGIVTIAGFASIHPDYSTETRKLEIAHTVFETDLECEGFLGYKVDAWYDADNMKVQAISADIANEAITLYADQILSYSNFILKVMDEQGRTQSYELERGFSFIKNGRIIDHEEEDFLFETGSLTLIDNDSNNRYEFVMAQVIEYFVVSSVEPMNRVVLDSNLPGREIVAKKTEGYNYSIQMYDPSNQSFEAVELEAIKTGYVFMLKQSEDGKLCDITVSTQTVAGVIEEIGEDYIVISGKEYKTNDYFKKMSHKVEKDPISGQVIKEESLIRVGSSGDFLLAADNTVTAVKNSSYTNMSYGYYLAYQEGKGLTSPPEIKILTTQDVKAVYPLAERVRLDELLVKNDSHILISALMNGNVPRYQLIRYAINKDGEVTVIDTADIAPSDGSVVTERTENSLTQYVDKKQVRYKSGGTVAAPYFVFRNSLVFEVPNKLITEPNKIYEDDRFFVSSVSVLVNDQTPTVDAYDYTEYYSADVVILYTVSGEAGVKTLGVPKSSAQTYMVESVVTTLDDDGDVTLKLNVFGNNTFHEFIIDPAYHMALVAANKIPGSGDIIRVSLGRQGKVDGIALDIEYNEKAGVDSEVLKINYGKDNLSNNYLQQLTYMSGKVQAYGSNTLTVKTTHYPSGTTLLGGMAPISKNSTCKFIIFNRTNKTVRAAKESSIMTIMDSGEDKASLVCAQMSYYNVNNIYIYMD